MMMEATNRKRCHGGRVVVIVAAIVVAVVFLIAFLIHDETSTLTVMDTSRTYMKDDKILVNLVHRPTTNNETPSNATSLTLFGNKTTMPNSFPNTTTTTNGTIVVYLTGEMGNHLLILAKSLIVQRMAKDTFGISAEFVLRHQDSPKWVNGRNSIQACFPKFRHYDFAAANTDTFDKLVHEQEQHEGANATRLQLAGGDDNAEIMEDALWYWKQRIGLDNNNNNSHHMENDGGDMVLTPFLTVAKWCTVDLVDRYFEELERVFEFDKIACCKTLPDPDESVFHLRNFLVEMPKVGKRLGFEELSPNKTALELFGHLNPGDKVAITTRFGGKDVEPYVSALERRGLQVRVMEGQSGTQDFCFLISAQKELVGSILSSFATWAAYLGNMKRANLYRVIGPNMRSTNSSSFHWTNKRLKDRVFTISYNSEEQDAWENANKQQ